MMCEVYAVCVCILVFVLVFVVKRNLIKSSDYFDLKYVDVFCVEGEPIPDVRTLYIRSLLAGYLPI